MTMLNTALNYSFTSSEAMRIALADRGAEDVVAGSLQHAAEASKFAVGSTITARYQYRVGDNGALIPVQTQITTDAPENSQSAFVARRNARQALRDDEGRAPPSFRDLSRPRPQLTPSDELQLFAFYAKPYMPTPVSVSAGKISSQISLSPTQLEASDEQGEAVEAELIAPPTGYNKAQAQFSVATLYARNNDVVYNVTPISQLAA